MKTSLFIAVVGLIYLTNAAPTDNLDRLSYIKNDKLNYYKVNSGSTYGKSNSYGEGEGEGKQGLYGHEIRYKKKYGEEEAYKRTFGYGRYMFLNKKNK